MAYTSEAVLFDEFFDLGYEERASPFLTAEARCWGHNLPLKSSLFAALLLAISFGLYSFSFLLPLSYLLLVGVYFLAGTPSLIDSIEDLLNFQINIDVLMILAAFSSVLIGSGFEGGLLLVLFALSGSIEAAVTEKAKGAISGLKKLSPSRAFVIENGSVIERAVQDIEVGARILVKAGDVAGLDGIVTEGASSVNLVHLTGENLPVPKSKGDTVPAGARNLEGTLTLKVTRTSADSTLAKIVELVTEAQSARPKLQRWFDTVGERYAVGIILASLFFTAVLPFTANIPLLGTEGSLYRSLAFLIAASPCALILAIPIAYLSAVSACARQGILLKGGVTLDALAQCEVIAFDKTGTLTTGELKCLGMETLSLTHSAEEALALRLASAMEKGARHPIAKALIEYAKGVSPQEITQFRLIAGYGVEAFFSYRGKKTRALLGRFELVENLLTDAQCTAALERIKKYKENGELLAILLFHSSVFLFRFSDSIRPQMAKTIETLRRDGRLRLLMLTGDHATSARKIAQELGIGEYHAELLPEHKLRYVTTLANECGLVMVGDGINDAPALARATVGICMGKIGSTTAVDASDVVLLHDELTLLPWLMRKAQKTQVIVKENLSVAAAAIIVASLSALLGVIPLWLAVVMHEGGTVLVGLNALRLLRR